MAERLIHVDPELLRKCGAELQHRPAIIIQQNDKGPIACGGVRIVCKCGHEVARVEQRINNAHVVVDDDSTVLVPLDRAAKDAPLELMSVPKGGAHE
jgi:hypothetical protein